MKAVRYQEFGVPGELVEVADPICPPDGVLVRVMATGLCRSDWHAFTGHDPVDLPHIPGHEFAGTVIAVGSAVHRSRVGQRVTAPFVLGCGACEFCLAGQSQVCPHQLQPGFTGPGSFAEVVVVQRADFNLVELPATVGFLAAACLGCRFATAYRALTEHGRLAAGQWFAVHGCGGVGLSALMIAVALGARVIAVDVSATARAKADELGAEVSIDPAGGDAAGSIISITGGGAHVSMDALGRPETAAASVRSLRRRGRHLQVGLLLGLQAMTALPMDLLVSRELEIYGSHGMPASDYPAMLELVASGLLRPDLLVGNIIGLDEAGPALAEMGQPGRPPGLTVIEI